MVHDCNPFPVQQLFQMIEQCVFGRKQYTVKAETFNINFIDDELMIIL